MPEALATFRYKEVRCGQRKIQRVLPFGQLSFERPKDSKSLWPVLTIKQRSTAKYFPVAVRFGRHQILATRVYFVILLADRRNGRENVGLENRLS
ncbi:hypothetical protein HYX70_02270 [Candidatus Saccharibacteria bacterium]|nr:hypothetical protein [Candidatus Saccharibacteria bacterium]